MNEKLAKVVAKAMGKNDITKTKYMNKIEQIDEKYKEIQTKIETLYKKLKNSSIEDGENILKEMTELEKERELVAKEQIQLYSEWYKLEKGTK